MLRISLGVALLPLKSRTHQLFAQLGENGFASRGVEALTLGITRSAREEITQGVVKVDTATDDLVHDGLLKGHVRTERARRCGEGTAYLLIIS